MYKDTTKRHLRSDLPQETYDGVTQHWVYRESDFTEFSNFITKHSSLKAVFSLTSPHGHINAQGNYEYSQRIKASDLPARRKRLLKQAIIPDETDKAIAALESHDPKGP